MNRADLDKFLAAKPDAETKLNSLDERELEVFSLMSQRLPAHLICQEAGLDAAELALVKKSVQKKLGCRTELDLLRFMNQQCASR